MNSNLYQLIFDKKNGQLVAVGENVKSAGKSDSGTRHGAGALHFARLSPLALAAWLLCSGDAALAQALPTGAQVVAGQATVTTSGSSMLINQATQRNVINWNTFNIGAGGTVQFAQPGLQSQSLNRVVGGGGASNIAGSLLANGQVFLQNPNGVIFGAGSVVNVGSLFATTRQVSASDFMAGNPSLWSTPPGSGMGAIENRGSIVAAPGGYVVMLADQVRNSGSITADQGRVVLAAGDSAVVSLSNGQGVQLALSNATARALVDNSGQIQANNGSVLLSASPGWWVCWPTRPWARRRCSRRWPMRTSTAR